MTFNKHWRFPPGDSDPKKIQTPEGFAINFAKRVESSSRFGISSGIALSQSFVSICQAAGFPLLVGDPVSGEPKGFEAPEPIYELLGQDLNSRDHASNHTKNVLSGEERALIEKAFKRDPERTRWLMEMAIGSLFWEGYKGKEAWLNGRKLALNAARVVQRPARFYFYAGWFSHKLGWNHNDKPHSEKDLLLAIAHHQAALTDPAMQWAASDLAMVHARFAENDDGWKVKPSESCILLHLTEAKAVADNLVKKWPTHYYSYFIRCVICSLLIQQPNSKDSTDNLLEQAERDLKTMGHLNPDPKYLYHCAEVEFRIAKNDPASAAKALENARTALRKTLENKSKETYISHFRQAGIFVPGFRPPPPESFVGDDGKNGRFKRLEDKIKSL